MYIEERHQLTVRKEKEKKRMKHLMTPWHLMQIMEKFDRLNKFLTFHNNLLDTSNEKYQRTYACIYIYRCALSLALSLSSA